MALGWLGTFALAPFRFALRIVLGPISLALRVGALVVTLVVGYFAVSLVQVWLTSRHYAPRTATSIVVMGSAQYNGIPSPDFRARLDEADLLYRQGYSRHVVVTGSKEKGDRFTESQAGDRYLVDRGVPRSAIRQAGGNDSFENLAAAAPIVKSYGGDVVLVVTDPFHEARSLAIASGDGLSPYPTPTRSSPISGWSTTPYFVKEAVGVGFGRVMGYQHLGWLHGSLP